MDNPPAGGADQPLRDDEFDADVDADDPGLPGRKRNPADPDLSAVLAGAGTEDVGRQGPGPQEVSRLEPEATTVASGCPPRGAERAHLYSMILKRPCMRFSQ